MTEPQPTSSAASTSSAAPAAPMSAAAAAAPAAPLPPKIPMARGSRFVGSLLIVGSLLLGVAALAYWKYHSIQTAIADAANAPEQAETVEAVTVSTTTWSPVSSLVGSVLSLQSIGLSNQLAGSVTKVGFTSGEVVEAGRVLLELDASAERANIAAAEAAAVAGDRAIDATKAQVRALEADLQLAQSNQARFQQAVTVGGVSQQDADRARTEVTRTQAQLDAISAQLIQDQANLALLRAQVVPWQVMLDKKTVRAPFRARVGIRSVYPGQYLMEGTQVATLTSVDDKVYVDFLIPQSVAAQAVPGMKIPATGSVLGPGTNILTVEAVDAQVDNRSRNIRVRTSIADPAGRLRPGMFIEISVPVALPRQVVVVPTAALRRAAYGDHVFTIKPDPKDASKLRVHQRMVKTAGSVGEMVIVTEGVEPGERIAGSGAFKLREGLLINLAPAPAAPGAPSTPAAQTEQSKL